MMKALEIVSNSWPIAMMFVALCGMLVLLRLIGGAIKTKRESNRYYAERARDVTPVQRDY